MASFFGYILLQDLGLTTAQRATLVAALRALGPTESPSPARLNHGRVSLDQTQVILEADFDDATLSAVAIRNRLASIFGVANTSITYATTRPTFGTRESVAVTFSYQTAPRLRLTVFAGLTSTHGESGDECRAYLSQNRAEWETPDA